MSNISQLFEQEGKNIGKELKNKIPETQPTENKIKELRRKSIKLEDD